MKEYPKTFENYFLNDIRNEKCQFDLIGVDEDAMPVADYIAELKKIMREAQLTEWQSLLKLTWLFRKFVYNGQRRRKVNGNGYPLDCAFAFFLQNYLGHTNRISFGDKASIALSGYFDELYPDFNLLGPMKATYEYPYHYMNFECLLFVHLIPERIELLEIGEQRAMTFAQFGDYILNYIFNYNEEFGEIYYLTPPGKIVTFPHINIIYENT